MIKSISMLLALLLLLSPYNYTNIVENPSISSPEETPPENQMDLTRYMRYFVNYFYEPYRIDPDVKFRDDILSLLIQFCYYNKYAGKDLDFVSYDEDYPYDIRIQGEGLQMAGKMLFGESFDAAEYRDLNTRWGKYDVATDTYITSSAKDYWGGEHYYLDHREPPVTIENGDTVTVTAYISYGYDIDGPLIRLTYSFIKKEYNGFLYYQFQGVSPAE